MAIRILIMGLPGAGKTYFAEHLKNYLETHGLRQDIPDVPHPNLNARVTWFNADQVRRKYNDWDFSKEGRIRQSLRMLEFALSISDEYVICDFVAPLPEMRDNFKADWTIWLDTIESSRYEDTNQMFVSPESYDFRITEKDAETWSAYVGDRILTNKRRPVFDWRKETVQMLGRWQPWHKGHRALFERALAKTGQVCIMVRDCKGWQNSNPFDFNKVTNFIKKDLDPLYQGQYIIQLVPNIVNITYGRDVGYKIEQEKLGEEIEKISATEIRKSLDIDYK